MMEDCPIRFQDITKKQLEESLKTKSLATITYCYMGSFPISIPIVVTEVKECGGDVTFRAETITPDDKEWDCCGYIIPRKNYGVMTKKLKKKS